QIALSRVVCAMHYPLDATTGEALGKAVFERAAATPQFQTDLALARLEYASLKASGKTSPACAAERLALSQKP
ncbi:MAG: PA-phosphatase, partial [Brevundimonas sp.]